MRVLIQRDVENTYKKIGVNSNISLYIKEENILAYLVRQDEWKSCFNH